MGSSKRKNEAGNVGVGTWDEQASTRLRGLILDGLKRGNEGAYLVADAVAEMRRGLNGRENLLKAWLLDVVDLPAATVARCLRMADAHAKLSDRDVWLAVGWDGVRKLVDALGEDAAALQTASHAVLAARNEVGLVTAVNGLVKDLIERYGQTAPRARRNTTSQNLAVVCAELRALIARHPDLLTEVSAEARRIVGLPLPVPAGEELAA